MTPKFSRKNTISELDRAKVREARNAAKAEARFARRVQQANDLARAKEATR
jgi:hypothetical protein